MGRVLSLIRGRRSALAALAILLLGAAALVPFLGALAAYAPGSVCAAHQWVAGITIGSGAASAISCTQPAAGDVSGLAASATTDTTNAGNISSGTLAAARGGAGTVSGALKGNGSGAVSQAAAADLSDTVAPTAWPTAPAIAFGGGSTGITYSLQAGTYYKLGKHVDVTFFITLTNLGSSTGGASVLNFPVATNSASLSYTTFVCPYYQNMSLPLAGGLQGRIAPGTSSATLSNPGGSAGQSDLTNTGFTNTTSFLCSASYISN